MIITLFNKPLALFSTSILVELFLKSLKNLDDKRIPETESDIFIVKIKKPYLTFIIMIMKQTTLAQELLSS